MNIEKRGVAIELHRQARRNYLRRRVEIKGLYDLFAADLVEMIPYADENEEFKYILTVINCFSKYAWAIPLKRKTGAEVARALDSIFSTLKKPPKFLQTDQGTEFYNSECQKIYRKYKIRHYSTFSIVKSGIIERFNRSLRNLMFTEFSIQGTYEYLRILPTLMQIYNNRYHRTIECTPSQVNERNQARILRNIRKNTGPTKPTSNKPKFKVGSKVRISTQKTIFEPGYTPNWSTEIFTVSKVQTNTRPITYVLKDAEGTDLKGTFYAEEMAQTKFPDVFLIEKVIERRGNNAFVKWLGFDETKNSWIPVNSILPNT